MGVVQLPRLITGAYICIYVQNSNADIDRMWTCQNITTSIFMNLPYSVFFRMTLYVYYIYTCLYCGKPNKKPILNRVYDID